MVCGIRENRVKYAGVYVAVSPDYRSHWLYQHITMSHNEHDGVSNHQPHDCLLNRLLRRRSKKTSKLRVTGLCAGNLPVTGEYPTQKASNAEMFPFDDVIMSGIFIHI